MLFEWTNQQVAEFHWQIAFAIIKIWIAQCVYYKPFT